MEDRIDKKLEDWTKVYILFRESNYIKFIDNYSDKLFIQSFIVWNKLAETKSNHKNKEYFTLEETIDLSKKFLNELDLQYSKYLDDSLSNGTIDIYDPDDESALKENLVDGEFKGPRYFKKEIENEEKTNSFKSISLPLEHNINDSYSLIHELFHAISADIDKDAFDWNILTESVSITYEFLLWDYLSQNNISNEDSVNPIIFRLEDLSNKSRMLSEGLIIYNKIKSNSDLLYKQLDKVTSAGDIEKQREEKRKYFRALTKTLEYYLGTLIAILNYKKYKEGSLDLKTIETYYESLTKNNELESLNVLFTEFPSVEEIKDALDFTIKKINDVSNKKSQKM